MAGADKLIETYATAVQPLFQLGDKLEHHIEDWIDYPAEYQLTDAHVPDLIQILRDEEALDQLDVPVCYGPIHAMRALGQLQVEAAIAPLIEAIAYAEESDYYLIDLPKVFSLMGAMALPALADCVPRLSSKDWFYAVVVSDSLAAIGKRHPVARDECVQILSDALRSYSQLEADTNAALVASLLGLQAVECAELIEEAYREGPMDEHVCGTWASVQVELGLARKEDFSPEDFELPPLASLPSLSSLFAPPQSTAASTVTASGLQITGGLQSVAKPTGNFGDIDLNFGKAKTMPEKQGFGTSAKPKKKKKKRK
ncbi:MAG: hypothetical protein AAFU71_08080 [Cyanobacteria bacterium J06632_22]